MADISTLVDTFDGTLSQWPTKVEEAGAIVIESGRAKIPCATTVQNYSSMATTTTYNFLNSSIYARVEPPPYPGTNNRETDFIIDAGSNNRAEFYILGTTIVGRTVTSGSGSNAFSITYDYSAHAWLKMASTGTTITFYTSPDGTTWTSRGTGTVAWSMASMVVRFASGYSQQAGTFAYVDNVNSPGTPPPGANGAIYTYEFTGGNAVNPKDGAIYTYEFTGGGIAKPDSGAVFAYEFVGGRYTDPTNGAVFVYENTVANANPAKWQFWDGTQWTRAYSYVWDGSAWQQVGVP